MPVSYKLLRIPICYFNIVGLKIIHLNLFAKTVFTESRLAFNPIDKLPGDSGTRANYQITLLIRTHWGLIKNLVEIHEQLSFKV